MLSELSLEIIAPCYNEQEVLKESAMILSGVLSNLIAEGLISNQSRLTFIDDGSSDNTWKIIESLAMSDAMIHGIKLSRNQGHQNAILAGMIHSRADAVISIDVDLQDDVSAIRRMVIEHSKGYEIVFGVRSCRKSDSLFKRLTAEMYYRTLNIFGIEVVFNHADYRLMGRNSLEALKDFSEANLFLRGIITQLGYKTTVVEYFRKERYAGVSKYPIRKMLSLAWDGITSFTTAPLNWITSIGFLVSTASFISGIWALWVTLIRKESLPGWASTVLPMYFLGGVQLLSIGIIGEYIAKIFKETKRRPRFIIEKII